jgi:hypothetical protein
MTLLKPEAPLEAQIFGPKDSYTAPYGLIISVYSFEPENIYMVSTITTTWHLVGFGVHLFY